MYDKKKLFVKIFSKPLSKAVVEYHFVYFSNTGVLFLYCCPWERFELQHYPRCTFGLIVRVRSESTKSYQINERKGAGKVWTVVLQNRPQWKAITIDQVPCTFLSKEFYRTLRFKWNVPKLVSSYIKSQCDCWLALCRKLSVCIHFLFTSEFSLEASGKW